MIALILDTETTGLYQTRKDYKGTQVYTDRITQLAYMIAEFSEDTPKQIFYESNQLVFDTDQPRQEFEQLLKNNTVTSISMQELINYGVLPNSATATLTMAIMYFKPEIIVGHNVKFDILAIQNELDIYLLKVNQYNQENAELLYNTLILENTFCTMQALTNIMQLPHNGEPKYDSPYKYPKLSEAYEFLFPEEKEIDAKGYHNAKFDVQITSIILNELIKRGKVNYNK